MPCELRSLQAMACEHENLCGISDEILGKLDMTSTISLMHRIIDKSHVDFNLEKATKMLVETLRWRESFGVSALGAWLRPGWRLEATARHANAANLVASSHLRHRCTLKLFPVSTQLYAVRRSRTRTKSESRVLEKSLKSSLSRGTKKVGVVAVRL